MLDELRTRWAFTRTSLLVIPDHHHRGHMLSDAGFCRWLEGLAAQGHEIVVHGYYHQRVPRAGETWRQRFITRVYTSGEGEFYDLTKSDAAHQFGPCGGRFSAQLDVPAPAGFIAPAWLLSDAAEEAVREAGFRYTTYLTGVRGLPRQLHRVAIPRLQSAQRLAARVQPRVERQSSRGDSGDAPLLRLGLHPPDYEHANLWRQIRRLVDCCPVTERKADDIRGVPEPFWSDEKFLTDTAVKRFYFTGMANEKAVQHLQPAPVKKNSSTARRTKQKPVGRLADSELIGRRGR